MRANIKKQLKSELINSGILEEGAYLDEEATFDELGVDQNELQDILNTVEENLGILFDEDLEIEMTVKEVIFANYS